MQRTGVDDVQAVGIRSYDIAPLKPGALGIAHYRPDSIPLSVVSFWCETRGRRLFGRALVERAGTDRARRRSYSQTLTVAVFRSALDALHYVGELTDDEHRDWSERVLVAVGIAPLESEPPGPVGATLVGSPEDLESGAITIAPIAPIFKRSIPVPDAEFDLDGGGKLRVMATNIYDTAVDIRWRVDPEPRPRIGHYRFVELSDDVGTPYWRGAAGQDGRHGEVMGWVRFSPAPPTSASALMLTLQGGLQIRLPLSVGIA